MNADVQKKLRTCIYSEENKFSDLVEAQGSAWRLFIWLQPRSMCPWRELSSTETSRGAEWSGSVTVDIPPCHRLA